MQAKLVEGHNNSMQILSEINYCWLCLIQHQECSVTNSTGDIVVSLVEIVLTPTVGLFGSSFGYRFPFAINTMFFSLELTFVAIQFLEKISVLTNLVLMVIMIGGTLLVALFISFIYHKFCKDDQQEQEEPQRHFEYILGCHVAIPLATMALTLAAETSDYNLPKYAEWCIIAGMMLITGILCYCSSSIIVPTAITGSYLVFLTLDLVYVQALSTMIEGTIKASTNYLVYVTGVICGLIVVYAVICGLMQYYYLVSKRRREIYLQLLEIE